MYVLLMRSIFAVVFVLSLISIFNPYLSWKIQQGWKFKNAEPSSAYLLATRIGGIFSAVVISIVFFQI